MGGESKGKAPTSDLERRKAEVLAGELPTHVGIIMDGNGRWAEQRGMHRLEGHRAGSESVRAVTTAARELGISALTLYAFSAQNWMRPLREVSGLMRLLRHYLQQERATLQKNGIRLSAIGQLDRLPRSVRKVLEQVIDETRGNDGMVLTLALSYGGREELVHAARRIGEDVRAGRLAPESIDEAAFEKRLWSGALPPLDLCIRTSGELRVSNFLPWQMAYAEIVVTDELWPDFREAAFYAALLAYQQRERRFGQTGTQIRKS